MLELLNGNSKLQELTRLSEKFDIDITCLQEHKLYHSDDNVKYNSLPNGWNLITSSPEKASNNATIRGIRLVSEPKSISLMVATFSGNPKVTAISCYSPTNCSEETEVSTFYDQLSQLIKQIPKHHILLIGGDMNAKIGSNECEGDSYHDSTNRNGEYLLDLLTQNPPARQNVGSSTFFL